MHHSLKKFCTHCWTQKQEERAYSVVD